MIEPRFGRPRVLPSVVCGALLFAAGCAGSSGSSSSTPAPAAPSSASSGVALPEEAGFVREIERMLASGDVERAQSALHAERDRNPKTASAAELRFAEGEIARNRGELEAAAVAYAGVPGASGGASLAGVAWERIAAVHASRKESAEELRALLKARDALDPRAQGSVNARIAALLGSFTPAERAAWIRAFPGAQLAAKGADGARNPAAGPMRIALLAPLTGRFEHFGAAFRLGAELALEEREAGASPAVELVVKDASSDPIATQETTRDAILHDGCVAVLGPILSVPIVAAGSVADSYRVPLLAPAVTGSRLSSIGSAVFSLDASPRELAYALAETSTKTLGLQTFVVVTPDDARSSMLAAEFTKEAKERGGSIVATVRYEPGKKDYRTALGDVKKTASDAVYILGEPDDLEIFAKQLDGVRLGRTVVGHGEWADDRVRGLAASSLEGAVFVLEEGESPASEFTQALEANVRKKGSGELSRFHVYGYEAMSEILGALELGARDAETLIEVLRGRDGWSEAPAGRRVGAWKRQGAQLVPLADR